MRFHRAYEDGILSPCTDNSECLLKCFGNGVFEMKRSFYLSARVFERNTVLVLLCFPKALRMMI